MDSEKNAGTPAPIQYPHSAIFWPFWSTVAVNLVLTATTLANPRAGGPESVLSYWIANTPIMLIVGVVSVALYRRQRASVLKDRWVGILSPIFGLAAAGCILMALAG